MSMYKKEDLLHFSPHYSTFVGIDSDGCVFPSMEIKQKECFHPEIIRRWNLQKVEKALRECAEFVNLYSVRRGINRFPALLYSLELLCDRPELGAAGIPPPALDALRKYVASGLPLSNATLKQELDRTGDPELARLYEWSLAVNVNVEKTVHDVAPFRWVRECLERISEQADIVVVSQTPEEALMREWKEQGMDHYPAVIAGQELGTKAEHLGMATRGRYPAHRILMIGDAPGDLMAARAVQALFYPINPGHEEESWKRLLDKAFDRFLSGSFAGDYQESLIREFNALLPETPPWKQR